MKLLRRIHIEKDISKMSEEQFLREAVKELQEKLKEKGEKFTFDIAEHVTRKREKSSWRER